MWRVLLLALWVVAGLCSADMAQRVSLRYHLAPTLEVPVYTSGQRMEPATKPAERLRKQPAYRSRKPVYLSARVGTGADNLFTFVLDESRGVGRGYDLLYADTNNNEDLADERPIRAIYLRDAFAFGPIPLHIEVNGKRQLYHAMVKMGQMGPSACRLNSACYTLGTMSLNGKRYPVALVDENANGLFNEMPDLERSDQFTGDLLLIDFNGNGQFDQEYPVSDEVLAGAARFMLGGKLYRVQKRADGLAITVTPDNTPLVEVRSDFAQFRLSLINELGVLSVHATTGVAQVPAGRYGVLSWVVQKRDESGRLWQVQGGYNATMPKPPSLEVKPGAPVRFGLSSPLKAGVQVDRIGEDYLFTLLFTTAAGEQISDLTVDDSRPPQPILRLLDADGKELAVLKFEYG